MNNTYEQIEKEFDERFTVRVEKHKSGSFMGYSLWDNIKDDFSSKEGIKSFLKQSFIKYLQSEVDRLEQLKLTPEHKGSYEVTVCGITNQVISDQITHITNQIKEITNNE